MLDEIQRAPELLPAIKREVDRNRHPGRFLLTGSANVLLAPRVSESLAGRMGLFTLWPLSAGEIRGGPSERFIELLYAPGGLPQIAGEPRERLVERLMAGGYPEVLTRPSPSARARWLRSYVDAVVGRDVRDLASIERLTDLPRLLALVAARSGGPLNVAGLGRDLGMAQTTVARYLALLEQVYLVCRLPAWFANIGKRLVKAPKLLVTDTALMAHLLGLTPARLAGEPTLLGPLLECFVGMELVKQAGWSCLAPRIHHLRTDKGIEVDFVLEDAAGRIAGIEVKAAATVRDRDLAGLHALAEAVGERFVRGVVLHAGERTIPFSDRLAAMPVGALWWTEPPEGRRAVIGRAGRGGPRSPPAR